MVRNEDDSYIIITEAGKCLEVQYGNRAQYSQVIKATCNKTPGQNWILHETPEGPDDYLNFRRFR